jgi:uncharacterized DUF497 family protein
MTVRFEWDPEKNALNIRKHGVGFAEAIRVFLDPFALTEHDRVEGWERRWRTIGVVDGLVVLLVAHTVDDLDGGDELIRVISARKAERRARERYEDARDVSLGLRP